MYSFLNTYAIFLTSQETRSLSLSKEIFLIKMILYNVYQSLEVYHVLVITNAIQILKC